MKEWLNQRFDFHSKTKLGYFPISQMLNGVTAVQSEVEKNYVIYKPWLGGVYAEYTTRGRGQRKFAAEINPERSEGFIEAANFR